MDEALKAAHIRQSVQFVNVVSATLFFFDCFLTMEREVELIWKASWNFGKVAFILARYSSFMDIPLTLYYSFGIHMREKTCDTLNYIASSSTVFGVGMVEIILILRTYALWGNNKKVVIFLGGLFITIYIPVLVVLALFLQSYKHGTPPLSIIRGCYPVLGSQILFIDYVLLMLNETIIMIFTLWIGVKRYRHSHNRLVITLYQDGITYFIYIFLVSCTYVVVLAAGPSEYVDLLSTFQRVLHTLLATRILLHVRDTARSRTNSMRNRTTTSTEQSTGVDFVSGLSGSSGSSGSSA